MSSIIAGVVASLAAAILLAFGSPVRHAVVKSTTYLAPPEQLKRLSFGYGENLADGLWLRTIQDCDVCEQARAGQAPHVAQDIFSGQAAIGASKCDRGWVYRMLDGATELAPRFRILYSLGAVMLSVMVDDREGARLLFEKGLKAYPNDWMIAFRAAYHYMYEIGDLSRAADLLVIAGRNGGPPWAFSLAAKIHTKKGQAFLARPILEEALSRAPDAATQERLKQRLKEANDALSAN